VIKAERLTTRQGDPYYILELLDAQGDRHEARMWNDAISGRAEIQLPREGQFWTEVKARPNTFKGQKQLVVDDYVPLRDDAVTPEMREPFIEKPVIDVDRVIERMFGWKWWDSRMQALMQGVREELTAKGVFDKIRDIPAGASYHHSVRGGFLLHIDEMLNFAESLCNVSYCTDDIQVDGVDHFPGLVDFQILRAAVVLHDIGKLYDYDAQSLQYQSDPIGECLEHTIVAILLVDHHWPNDSPEAVDRGLRLKHAIAAHHGPEMGAVKPKTPEAILVHHLDMISASLDVCRRAYAGVQDGNAPEYSRMLGARPFVPKFPPDNNPTLEQVPESLQFTQKLPWEN
jgi:3'-5' exoribonuclease